MLMTNFHDKGYGERTIELATMRCYLIENANNAQVGDFVYHYSSQLDAFAHYEVMDVNLEHDVTLLECVLIDDDIVNLIGKKETFRVDKNGRIEAYKLYRPDVDHRTALEKKGGVWEGEIDFITALAGSCQDTRRRIRNKIFVGAFGLAKPKKKNRFWEWFKTGW